MLLQAIQSKFVKLVPWTYVIEGFHGEEILATFYEKQLQKKKQKEFMI